MYKDEEHLYFNEYGKYISKTEALLLGPMISVMGTPVVYGINLFDKNPFNENLLEYRE